MTTEDEFLTVAESAAILKLNPQTSRNWIAEGRLPADRIGRRVRIRRVDFDHLIADSETRSRSPSAVPAPAASNWDGEIPPPVVP